MQLKPYFLIIICLLFLPAVKCQDNWKLKKDKNGIKVYSRKTKAYKFDELKVECVFESRISQLAAVILDAEHQYQWAYKTSKSQVLKQNNAADIIYYSEIECPWPFENRDLVARMTAEQNATTKVLTIVAKSVNDYMPAKKKIVRIKYSDALWTVTPLNDTQVKVEYKIQADPGDGVPAWVLNMFATDGPYETFVNLKEKIKLPEYIAAKLPFITD